MQELELRVEALRNAPPSAKHPPYLDDPAFLRYRDRCLRRHSKTPGVPPFEYLASKRQALAERLGGRTLLYLDTNHWVKMRDLEMGRSGPPPEYAEVLKRLRLLRRREKICCPASGGLIVELMKQTDVGTRRATARMMDCLGGGACLRNWISVAKEEVKQHALRGIAASPRESLVWTKVADCFASLDRRVDHALEGDDAVCAKAEVDVVWKCGVEDYASSPNWIESTTYFGKVFEEEGNREAAMLREEKETFPARVAYAKGQLLRALKAEMIDALMEVAPAMPGSPMEQVEAVWDPFMECVDIHLLPTLQVFALVDAAMINSSRKFRGHDVVDFEHVAQAMPYCDAFFCDTPIKNLLCGKPLELNVRFGVPVLSTPGEILDFLMRRFP